jgi:hypothetical protein
MELRSIGLHNFIGKNIVLSFLFLLTGLFLSAQEKGISLKKENSKKTIFLKENKRIKIITKADKKIIGNYTILDDKTIMIADQVIAIDSIESISSHSRFSSVASPLFVVTGTVFMALGTFGLIVGGYGIILSPLIPVGLPMVLVPIRTNKHKSENWKYQIVN